jgi:uncharacterized membrane protein YtjA (UPF0391 family)
MSAACGETLCLSQQICCAPTQNQGEPIARPNQEPAMLHYAVIFFVIALIAALFGFGGIAAGAVGIAKILFFVFIVLAVASFVWGMVSRN